MSPLIMSVAEDMVSRIEPVPWYSCILLLQVPRMRRPISLASLLTDLVLMVTAGTFVYGVRPGRPYLDTFTLTAIYLHTMGFTV